MVAFMNENVQKTYQNSPNHRYNLLTAQQSNFSFSVQ